LFARRKGTSGETPTQQHAIHYHSLYDNKILRKFRGHVNDVADISMCPANDCFLTSSSDRTVRLWTLQEAGCLGQMELPAGATGTPHAVYDSTGLVLGITASGSNEQYVHLYDARNYASGAFAELKVPHASIEAAIQNPQSAAELSKLEWSSIAFNASGNQLLATCPRGLALLLDGFEGTVQKALYSEDAVSACFTADDKNVLMGNKDGTIGCWNVDSGKLVKKLSGHTGPVGCIASNPKYAMFASSCTSTALWLW
jgi:COMPASS component SWD2